MNTPDHLIKQPNFILIGPPGSGKGTFSFFMVQKRNYHQICIGDIIRTHKKKNTDIGKAILANGGFVDDEMAYSIIKNEIDLIVENKTPFIIDGFPRNIPAFEFLIQELKEKDVIASTTFVHFKIDDQVCIDRINNRLVCFKCFDVFNTTTKKPKKEMICDSCDIPLEVREGDAAAATIKRLACYRAYTEPLIEVAKKNFNILTIDANSSIEGCLAQYKNI